MTKTLFDPEMIEPPVYVCGDIHGRMDLMQEFLDWVSSDALDPPSIVFLGDYIDRGRCSKEVLETLITGPSRRGERWYPIRGNHEELLVLAYRDDSLSATKNWLMCGGIATLRSYGYDACVSDIPKDHIAFLESLPLGYDDGERLYVHAGVRPNVPLWCQEAHDLMWIREPFLSHNHGLDRIVVHGHTPELHPVILPHRIGLDTAAYHTGMLSAARFNSYDPEPRIWISG